MNFKKKTIEPDKNLRNIGPRIILLLDKLIFNLLAWNVLLRVFFFLNYLINPDLIFSGAKIFQISHERGFVLTGMASLVAGFSWLFEDVIFYKYLSRKGLGNLFIIRFFFIVIMLAFVLLLFTVYHYQSSFFSDISEYLILLKGFFLNRTTVYLFLIGIIISIGINFFKAIRQKVGYEKFFRIISGYYRKPKEENRIFIFIDLISSTHYAELLGHKKYSAFLQECFKHLGILEIKYRAMQYQIVGDEVVLSWSADKEKNFRYAVNFYYEFQALLSKKAGFFKKEYGVIPSFTASINAGKIMVAEVGTVKSEIAFHGDVLNTAARIQKQCKSYDRSLLVTDSFVEKFKPFSQGYKTEWVTHDPLTGKSKRVGVYAVFPENGNDFQSEKIKTKKKGIFNRLLNSNILFWFDKTVILYHFSNVFLQHIKWAGFFSSGIFMVRHAAVDMSKPVLCSSSKAKKLLEAYNNLPIIDFETDSIKHLFGTAPIKVYTSSLPRAIQTARLLFPEYDSIPSETLFNEYQLSMVTVPLLFFPYDAWTFLSRVFWITRLNTKGESRVKAKRRMKLAADELVIRAADNQRIVLVAHGYLIADIKRELKKRGWQIEINQGHKNLAITKLVFTSN